MQAKSLSLLCLVILSHQAWCLDSIRGVNYDPAHDPSYSSATTVQIMDRDFKQIKGRGFNVVKTYISKSYGVVNLAELACKNGLKVMLGVYEFRPGIDSCIADNEVKTGSDYNRTCTKWRAEQVQAAIESAISHPDCIVGIVVGNEDMYGYSPQLHAFARLPQNRDNTNNIQSDIKKIRSGIFSKNSTIKIPPIGTAQQDGALKNLAEENPNNIISDLDFIGVNIYPYWDTSNVYSPKEDGAKKADANFQARLTKVVEAFAKYKTAENKPLPIVITEEGWPSQSYKQPPTTLADEVAYFNYWLKRNNQGRDSYFFSFYDKNSTYLNPNDAENNFGLYTKYNKQKSDLFNFSF